MLWCVWLADGTTFESAQGKPADVPMQPRIVCIAQETNAWGPVLTNGDWYLYRDDLQCWTEHTDMGALLEMTDHADMISVCRAGKYLDRAAFKAYWAEARKWAGIE